MKKFLIIFITLFLVNCHSVYAKDLMIEVKVTDNEKTLEYYEDNRLISFKEANQKFNVPNYVTIKYGGQDLYFYQGKEIDDVTYNNGIDEEHINLLLKEYTSYGYRVRNTSELINTITMLFEKRDSGIYHLVYSKADLSNIDFLAVEEYVKNNYMFDSSVNTFNYSDHGIINYPKYMFNYDGSEMVINISPVISEYEEVYLNRFLDSFIVDFENKTDYENILFAYTYLKNTISSCNGGTKTGASAYDALLMRNASCIGESNAFQLIMERMGIESYIVEDMRVENDNIIINHTFNVVNLEGKYYIIDLQKDSYNGFLAGNTNNYVMSNGKVISNLSYKDEFSNINIDYNKYDRLIDEIITEMEKNVSLSQKKDDLETVDFVAYMALILILLFLTLIIIYFTRKGR